MRKCVLVLLAGALLCANAAWSERYHVIIAGSGGEEPYIGQFQSWGERLQRVLVDQLGAQSPYVYLLTEAAESPEEGIAATSDVESIRSVFEIIAQQIEENDSLFVYLMGHGSYYKSISRVHVPGADLTSDDMKEFLQPFAKHQTVIINGTPCSAVYVNELSEPNRVICTATKSVTEFNATEFMGHFIECLEDGSADRNRDERITVFEACQQAAQLTDAWYISNGYLPTEHAILDDNGDGQGTRLTWDQTIENDLSQTRDNVPEDGDLARRMYLKDYVFPVGVPQEWIDEYTEAMNQVDELRNQKPELDEAEYYRRLEEIFLRAARVNRKIRSFEAPDS